MANFATASECFESGNLAAAIEAALAEVKESPSDTGRRGLLAELLCFNGAWERADKQIDTIGHQEPEAIAALSQIRQLIRAEVSRDECFGQGKGHRRVIADPAEPLRLHIEALVAIRDGDLAQAAELLAKAEETRQPVTGTSGESRFEDFRDVDDVTASFFEVLATNGSYFWIPIDRVVSIEFHPPKRPRDLLWRKCDMTVRDGPDGEVCIPTTYPGTRDASDDQLTLGRATDWVGGDGEPARGRGQRTFLVGDEPVPIMQLTTLEFDTSDS